MRTKTISAVALVLPFLVLGCDRQTTPSSTSAAPRPETQAMGPASSPEKMMENAPPAAGMPPQYGNEQAPASGTSPTAPPADSPATPQR